MVFTPVDFVILQTAGTVGNVFLSNVVCAYVCVHVCVKTLRRHYQADRLDCTNTVTPTSLFIVKGQLFVVRIDY